MSKLRLNLGAGNSGTWGLYDFEYSFNPTNYGSCFLVKVGTEPSSYDEARDSIPEKEWLDRYEEYFNPCAWGIFGKIDLSTITGAGVEGLPFSLSSNWPFVRAGYLSAGTYTTYSLYKHPQGGEPTFYKGENYVVAPKVSKLSIMRNEDGSGKWIVNDLQYLGSRYEEFYLCAEPFGEGSPGPMPEGSYISKITAGSAISNATPMGAVSAGTLESDKKYYAYGWYKQCENDAIWQVAPAATPGTDIPPEPTKPDVYVLTTEIYPNDPALAAITITPASGNQYEVGTEVEVSVEGSPPTGWEFLRWEVDASGKNRKTTVIMDGNKTARAIYVKKRYEVILKVFGDKGGSTRPLQDSVSYIDHGESMNIEAIPDEENNFVEWTGDYTSENRTDTIENIESNMIVYANFKKREFELTLKRTGINLACGGKIKVVDGTSGAEYTASSEELLLGKIMKFPVHTPLIITAEGLDDPITQFEIWNEGATLKKIKDGEEEDTLADDPTQYLKDFTANRTMSATFFCRPDQRPRPKWNYNIKCPVPTVKEGSNWPHVPITL